MASRGWWSGTAPTPPRPSRVQTVLVRLTVVLWVVAVADFTWFFFEAVALGGDALYGLVRDGHYYLASHGHLTEVSAATWQWSRWHGLSAIGLHGLAFGSIPAWWLWAWTQARRLPPRPPRANR